MKTWKESFSEAKWIFSAACVAFVLGTSVSVQAGMAELARFGTNPGNLKAYKYTPKSVRGPNTLIVVLHGCLQTVGEFDDETGWTDIAERSGAVLLFPEQKKENNGAQCFNWFLPEDARAGHGEMESLRQMISTTVTEEHIASDRIFAAGFSSGGAVVSALLANHPELFKAAAIFSGVTYGCANSVNDGFLCMNGMYTKKAQEWGDLVRAASKFQGERARVTIWHGTSDQIIKPMIGGELVKQWTNVLGVAETPTKETKSPAMTYQAFANAQGEVRVEYYSINKMKHGQPIKMGSAKDSCGKSGKYVLEAGICGSYTMAKTWGLLSADE